MACDLRYHRAAFRAALVAAGLSLLPAVPHDAWAKDGGSQGGHSGDSGTDDSGSGGHGSDDSDHSGSSSHSDKGGDDGQDDKEDAARGRSNGGQERRRAYEGGWRVQIRDGRYQVFDPAGRVVINRKARISDYKKF